MSYYLTYVCDRCRQECKRNPEFIQTVSLPIPSGHVTRVDVWEQTPVDLCKDCHEELNRWINRESK